MLWQKQKFCNWQFADSVQDMNSTIKEKHFLLLSREKGFFAHQIWHTFCLESTWLHRFILQESGFFCLHVRGDGGLLELGAVKSRKRWPVPFSRLEAKIGPNCRNEPKMPPKCGEKTTREMKDLPSTRHCSEESHPQEKLLFPSIFCPHWNTWG